MRKLTLYPAFVELSPSPWHHLSFVNWNRFLLAGLLAVFLARIVLTYRVFNDTSDESFHIQAGLEFLQQGTYTFEPQHPPLARAVVALLPYYFGGLRFRQSDSLWRGEWGHHDVAFFWKTLSLARAGNLVFAILVFFFVFRWSLLLYGQRAAWAAALLISCCPNLLAHASLAALDIAAAATVLMTAFFLWRWVENPGWRYCLASGVAFGLAVLSKFSALAFLPPLVPIYFLIGWWMKRRGALPAVRVLSILRAGAFCLLVAVTVWAGYRFDVGPLVPHGHHFHSRFNMGPPSSLPNLLAKRVINKTLVAPRFWEGLVDVLSHNQTGHQAYLLGQLSDHGWWYYFPVAVAVKTTLPLLALLGIAAGMLVLKRDSVTLRRSIYPLWAILVVMGVSIAGNLNIGVRHVLPVFPLFAILASGVFSGWRQPTRLVSLPTVAACLLAWHIAESVLAHPDYLPYFNQIARGQEEEFLVDSNLDWGQDLARLGTYLQQHRIESVQLNYFGSANAARLGVPARSLPPEGPDAGWAAISINRLKGIESDPAYFQWIAGRKPVARVGKSIWLYYFPTARKVLLPGHAPHLH